MEINIEIIILCYRFKKQLSLNVLKSVTWEFGGFLLNWFENVKFEFYSGFPVHDTIRDTYVFNINPHYTEFTAIQQM